MENIIIRYSDFIDDDGGFQKLIREFDSLGDTLIKRAEEIKKAVNIFDVDQSDNIKELETSVESINKAFKKYEDTRGNLNKLEEEFNKTKQQSITSDNKQLSTLIRLDKELQTYRSNLKEVNTLAKLGAAGDRDLNEERVKAQLNIKRVTAEIRRNQKEVLESNELSREERKLLEARITLEQRQVKTLTQVRERIAALRVVVQSLDFQEQADEVKAYNDEINELTDVLGANSDKFIQSKINIGNYEESIVNALKSTNLFNTGIGGLDSAISSIIGALTLTGDQLDDLEKSMAGNTNAIKRFTLAFGRLNRALKASIIGIVIVAVAGLASAFGNTRAGAIRLQKVTQTLTTVVTNFGQTVRVLFEAIPLIFANALNNLNPFSRKVATNTEFIGALFTKLERIMVSGAKSIVLGLDNIERAFLIEDEVRALTREVELLNGELTLLQGTADDSTRSLTTQLLANARALELIEEIGERNVTIAEKQLEAVNERLKQNILANQVEADNIDLNKTGLEFAQSVADLAKERGVGLEIANDLIEEQNQAVLALIGAENELAENRRSNTQTQREIDRDLFEQNLDLLIDLTDAQRNVTNTYITDVRKNFQSQIEAFNRFVAQFGSNALDSIDEFNRQLERSGIQDQFNLEFDPDGTAKIFIGDTELALDNVQELNTQLQATGLNEIEINRFRELILFLQTGVLELRNMRRGVDEVGIAIKTLTEDLGITDDEVLGLDRVNERLRELANQSDQNISPARRRQILREVKELEEQKAKILEGAERRRLNLRAKTLEDELQTVEAGGKREAEILLELAQIRRQIRQEESQDTIKDIKDTNDKAIAEWQKFFQGVNQVLNQILDKALQVNRERVQDAEKRVDRQGELVDEQRRRAELGLTNTLAFEQEALGDREAELIQQQKRLERLERIRALYSSYNNYASRGDENPIAKALRDFAILESITATFKEGGLTGIDGVKTNGKGITLGKRHDSNGRGGNLAWHERGEGFFSRQEVNNMGHDNFYRLKELAGDGRIGSNFFSDQQKDFVMAMPTPSLNGRILTKLNDVEQAIKDKPVSNWHMGDMMRDVVKIVEETTVKNKRVRNIHVVKKPRA